MSQLKRTPLFSLYEDYGAKTIDFGGWDLPVQFSSIKKEHEAVRAAAGVFDVSHMGEIRIKGENSLPFLQRMLTNDLSKLPIDGAQYNIMCNENGGTIDDLLVYKLAEDDYLLVVNAANTEKDFGWLKKHAKGEVNITDVSNDYGLIAIQGPKAQPILQKIVKGTNLDDIKPFKFKQNVEVSGSSALVSRTGYTGEDGFEIYCDAGDTMNIWESILEAGNSEGLLPSGLGARDTLRFEAGLALYGQELSSSITPLEAGLGFAVKLNKSEDFIGKQALQKQKEEGPPRSLAGIEMIDRGIPRNGYKVFDGDEEIGYVTSGTQSPTLKKNIGNVLITSSYKETGKELDIEIRNKRLKAKIVETPFYKR